MQECCEQVEELVDDSETSNSVRDEPIDFTTHR